MITFIGDAATSTKYTPPGFPTLVGQTLGIPIHNLAVVSALRHSVSYHVLEALREQLPTVPPDTTDAVVFLGTDDLDTMANGPTAVEAVEAQFLRLTSTLKSAGIRVHLVTVRNYSQDPSYSRPQIQDKSAWQARMQGATDTFDDWMLTLGFPTLDVRRYPDLMANASYRNGVVFSPPGLNKIAAHVASWFQKCDRDHCVPMKTL
ncbi:MAG: hypothetical protein M3N19_00385 [Candidatus Eremiobacteraeota bacterium]|nr:hypothetical protein [Candidatus Eremiobacteraeota bacterium]